MILALQTTTFGAYGGIPTYNRLVCRVLNALPEIADSHVFVATDKQVDIKQQSGVLARLHLEAFDRNRVAFIRRVMHIALSRRVDLVLIGHVNYAPLGLVLRCLQPELRYGVMVHGVEVWSKLPLLISYALRQANFVTAVSDHTRQLAIEVNRVQANRLYLLPNALEWQDDEKQKIPIVPELTAGTRLLSVCRLDSADRYKGVDTVIEALPTVMARIPDIHYLVIGDGTDLERHKRLAESLGVADRVHLLGLVDAARLRNYYQVCDVFVMPSAGEGFGIVFLEAMKYSKPIVAANSGGAPEVVQDGVTGSLVEYGNKEQLAETLVSLCLDPNKRQRLGQAGYRRLQERFTYTHFRQRLTEILLKELPPKPIYKFAQTDESVSCAS